MSESQIIFRAAAHLRTKGIFILPIRGLGNLSRIAARSVEQVLIDFFGLSKNGDPLLNQINSIARTNPIYQQAIQQGTAILHNLGLFGF